MALFKCKMCGGTLEISNETVATCEYCGTQQTLPKLDDDRRANLYDRANHFRRNNEFDKAMGIYEQILSEDNTDAEAYWSLVLCRYGIEYVEDPASHKRIPTVNRAQFTSIFDDDNYKSALQYADGSQRSIYEEEARAINEIQKGILAISQKEEPFDVFVCYKETDNNGRRTPDSVLAQDLYYQLTQEGFKVFFSRITLEDKLGAAYEPYIFAALNSAKVMVVLGTRPEYFNAVWVKNEWSRYLALIKQGQKKMLIPAYKDMDPYDLPQEFSHLQAQDMSKLGFMQDLIRGIKKIIDVQEPKAAVVKETVVTGGNANTAPLLERAFMFLEDGDWDSADEYCEKVLDIDPKIPEAYLGKMMAQLRVRKQEALKDQDKPFDGNNNYQKILRFADEQLRSTLAGYIEHINSRNEHARLEGIYTRAQKEMSDAKTELGYLEAAYLFETISEYLDAGALAQTCREKAEVARKDAILSTGKEKMRGELINSYEAAIKAFESIPGWKDADDLVSACQKKIEEIKAIEETARIKSQRLAERKKKITIITVSALCVITAFIILLTTVIIPSGKYKDAMALADAGKYTEAALAYGAAGNYSDAKSRAFDLWERIAVRETISAEYEHTVGLKADGTVVAVGANSSGQCNVNSWEDIVAISVGDYHTVGLKADGTVVAVGSSVEGRCDVNGWKNVVAISAGFYHTVGLKADGTVVAVGKNDFGECDVNGWEDIVAISAGGSYTVGLKADGTVVAVGYNGDGRCNVNGWEDIVAISAGGSHTVGLKADGTVVAVGNNDCGQWDVNGWEDIVAISAGFHHTVGLKADGTLVAVGYNGNGKRDVNSWEDIVAISAGSLHTAGLRADGTVVAVGDNYDGQCNVSGWEDIKVPD